MSSRILLTVGFVLVGTVVLSACRADEQGRLLDYQKGVYLGKTEAPLSAAMLKTLRARTAYQAGVVDLVMRGGDVRPPTELDTDALRQRNRNQRDTR